TACVCVPGAVVLYAGATLAMGPPETTAVRPHGQGCAGSVNAPGPRLEVGAARPFFSSHGPSSPSGTFLQFAPSGSARTSPGTVHTRFSFRTGCTHGCPSPLTGRVGVRGGAARPGVLAHPARRQRLSDGPAGGGGG